MANRGRATFAKRQREIARQERAREKAAKRADRIANRVKPDREREVDPDLEGIVPGPQPLPYEVLDGDVEPDDLVAGEEEKEEAAN